MGMHFGVLASTLSSAELLARIEALAPAMQPAGDPGPLAEIDLQPTDEGWGLAAADHGVHGFVVDSSFMLSGMVPDLIARIAADSGALVVGACAETVSGTFAFVAARGGTVLRHYYHCYAELGRAYSSGAALASEARWPLDDIDGNGLFEAMKELGPDYGAFLDAGAHARPILWSGTSIALDGPLAAALAVHREAARLPADARPGPQLVMRVTAAPSSTTKKPWWKFW